MLTQEENKELFEKVCKANDIDVNSSKARSFFDGVITALISSPSKIKMFNLAWKINDKTKEIILFNKPYVICKAEKNKKNHIYQIGKLDIVPIQSKS